MKKWFIDTNVITNWILSTADEETISDIFELSEELHLIYQKRYQNSVDFLNKLLNSKNNEIYISELVMNELISAVKEWSVNKEM